MTARRASPRPAALAAAVAAVALGACSAAASHAAVRRGSRQMSVTVSSARSAATPAATTARLSPAQLAGQRIVYAYAGLRPPASLMAAIRAGEAGGVVFFAPNIASPAQIHGVIAQMQKASLASPLRAPLLMMTDQEGGEVRRLPGAPVLSEKQIGASPDPVAQASAAGAGAARTLAAAGMNVNLAPVLDVYRHAGNFIDEFQRSYSSNPAVVASLGAAFISAQQQDAVAATAKHFPGLGAATAAQDTDAGPVTLTMPLSTLRTVDEAPYRSAIAAGVKLVMVSWAVYPALDPHLPAGLSPTVIGRELRGRLGFRGVTITDGIDAGAVTPYGTLATRGERAAAAGADLVLCAATNPADNSPTQGTTVRNAIAAALQDHRMSLSAAQQSAARVLALREQP